MSTLTPLLISWLQLYGYPALWICVFIAAFGAPLPTGLVLLAAGAFAALGDFNIYLLVAVASSASICGDNCGYLLGRRIGSRILNWLGKKRRIRFISPQVLERSQEYFQQRGAWAILLSRCILTAFGGCINILAGAECYPYRRFLLYDIIGEIIGAAIPLTKGYIFGVSWEAIGTLLTTTSLLVLAFIVVIYLTAQLVRIVRRIRATTKKKTQLLAEIAYEKQEGGIERQA
ncbi:MAG: VTT domain-containing protein [Ktedonobacteraceae bacterium]|nr:VTT domain-containing protein [Ktedonobacteraceae bacterium]